MARPLKVAARRIGIVGAGWSGLAAAVSATSAGADVTLFEMAHTAGGRARSARVRDTSLDNGQHILIGAYVRTLALMQRVGADPAALLMRLPLSLRDPHGVGLALPRGRPVPAFVRAVLTMRHWRWSERAALLAAATRWAWAGFTCPDGLTVADLCARLPATVRDTLIDPLCVAALNTSSRQASAAVFLRVLRDALFSGPGSADLLLPRAPLSTLLPTPALAWLRSHGALVHLGHRVTHLAEEHPGWRIGDQRFDAVILACTPHEAARLTVAIAPAWSHGAATMNHQPIITAYLHDRGLRLPHPMVALHSDERAPAQFAFDLGTLGWAPDTFAFVISGADSWVQRGLPATSAAVLQQAQQAFPGAFGGGEAALRHIAAERRATFACTPRLARPPAWIAPGLCAAGDYVAGPYPATLEGAVRAGEHAAAMAVAS